jgi:hypothetical protein
MKQSTKPAPRAAVSPRSSVTQPPACTAAQIAHLADRALAGDVVSPGSIEGLSALLDELRRRGFELKRRTEWEQSAAPWLFIVTPIVSAETEVNHDRNS